MGLFQLFSKKHKKNQIDDSDKSTHQIEVKSDAKKIIRLASQADRMNYIKDNCEIIIDSERQTEEAKAEYQAVTSYLTDMQRIDMIPLEERDILEDAARKIINLTKERSKLRSKSSILSDQQYHLFEQYELQIPKDLPVIRDSEQYQEAIQQDMAHLEKEREKLDQDQDDIVHKQSFLKGIAITTCVIVVTLFLIFAFLSGASEANFTLPFLLTVLMGMVLALYIFMEARKNSAGIRLVQAKQNRQIMLMNKVVIKSVNNRNFLDYTYNKYMVNSYEQLKALWEEYVKIKDEARRYQSNTELLEFYNNELIQQLKKFGVKDSEIWIYQPNAIIDSKEMVEVRHRLNVRRQKLRERIETSTKQREAAIEAITATISSYPECKEEAERMLRRYRIELAE